MNPSRAISDVTANSEEARRGQLILIPKSLRMEWVELMAVDPRLKPIVFRAAVVIGRHFNRRSGDTFVSQNTIARLLGVSSRTVWDAIMALETRGYLIVTRRDLGRRKDGRRVSGGKGMANVYAPAFEHEPICATAQAGSLADRCAQVWAQRSKMAATSESSKVEAGCDLSGSIGRNGVRPLEVQRSQNSDVKVATSCDPTYQDNLKNGLGGDDAGRLGQLIARLRERLGERNYLRTFERCRFDSGPPFTLSFPSPLLRNNASNRCGPLLCEIFGADVCIAVGES